MNSGGEAICAVKMPQGACIEVWLHISPPSQGTLRPEFNGMQIPYELSFDCACSRATAPDMTNQHSCT